MFWKNPIGTIGGWILSRQTKLNLIQKVMPKAGHLAKVSNLQNPQNIPYIQYVNV